jgi:hypothetical protein
MAIVIVHTTCTQTENCAYDMHTDKSHTGPTRVDARTIPAIQLPLQKRITSDSLTLHVMLQKRIHEIGHDHAQCGTESIQSHSRDRNFACHSLASQSESHGDCAAYIQTLKAAGQITAAAFITSLASCESCCKPYRTQSQAISTCRPTRPWCKGVGGDPGIPDNCFGSHKRDRP